MGSLRLRGISPRKNGTCPALMLKNEKWGPFCIWLVFLCLFRFFLSHNIYSRNSRNWWLNLINLKNLAMYSPFVFTSILFGFFSSYGQFVCQGTLEAKFSFMLEILPFFFVIYFSFIFFFHFLFMYTTVFHELLLKKKG